ncbi:3-dehydroquinate dehydratase [Piscirickettsia salmonis]|uniref:3-dehydroquinate dehydratase n=2 Tax=Piscirickettsia salmonis TaxID=1238 RepID=A0A9Q6LJE1_PISSA|nr:3-dehydroquinate dehydratase [Piscirickettsia salmonis]QGO04358.1 3-dehydroquinate dehydratase [Piscirickettsia salmonis]QGO32927.1 3-dehydroquinate dehydratase [Piscirickettsia salmonis]QGO36540.1 3-dehydroquinate dehydratase [Piscirickettsia salmonis]QGO40164.1 3-dehydroquinate dehydratase [Piscirickettsia salmonis]
MKTINMFKIQVLHGPNLNLLGLREPDQYGLMNLTELDAELARRAGVAGVALESFQSNVEHELLGMIHQMAHKDHIVDFIIFNPAAFTHTSIALRDALTAVQIPFIEVHLSNVHAREKFRQHSYFSDIAQGVITGLGAHSYFCALEAAIAYCQQAKV